MCFERKRARERLQSLSWFMKCLKEPLSRLANREEQTRGAFFEGRFKSVAILDEEALLATCASIDLLIGIGANVQDSRLQLGLIHEDWRRGPGDLSQHAKPSTTNYGSLRRAAGRIGTSVFHSDQR